MVCDGTSAICPDSVNIVGSCTTASHGAGQCFDSSCINDDQLCYEAGARYLGDWAENGCGTNFNTNCGATIVCNKLGESTCYYRTF